MGLALLAISTKYPLALIDEPEAFLHPPQARLLGRTLAQAAAGAMSQLVIATHSLDVLRGVLDANVERLTVVRLRREGTTNHASVLPPDRVQQLWSDPLIRFSNALDGVFHRGVVVCEADGDARFYDAALLAARKRIGVGEHELLFTHCGGKARVATVVEALRALDVPVRAVCDIDVLREEPVLRGIVEALRGDWTLVEQDSRIVKTQIDSNARTNPSVDSVRAEIASVLEATTETRVTADLERRIREIVKAADGWDVLKRAGVAGAPNGEASAALNRLLQSLAEMGLMIPRVGELEGWDKELGGHGPVWVIRAMEAGLHLREGPASEFAMTLGNSFN